MFDFKQAMKVISFKNKNRHASIAIIVLLTILVVWIGLGNTGPYTSRRRPDPPHINCSERLNQSVQTNRLIVEKYKFPSDIDPYMDYLFPEKLKGVVPPTYPTFVTAFSGNHVEEGIEQMQNFNKYVRNQFPNSKFIFYDLGGITEDQRKAIKDVCKCEMRKFPFDKFPRHIKTLKGCVWKPLTIQLVAKDHPFVVWMDTSLIFEGSTLYPEVQKARTLGVLAGKGGGNVALRTSEKLFEYFGETACPFSEVPEFQAGFVMVYENDFVREYFMKKWTACALTFGCMIPDKDVHGLFDPSCDWGTRLHLCHRFDQSVLNILMHRLFSDDFRQHQMQMKEGYFSFGRGYEIGEYLFKVDLADVH